jgi:hypothetical protein
VCLTVIGILRLVNQLSKVNTIGDDLLALAALGCLVERQDARRDLSNGS